MNLARAICQLHEAESKLAAALRAAGDRHPSELGALCQSLALQTDARAAAVGAWAARCHDPWEVEARERSDALLTALRWRRRAAERRGHAPGPGSMRDVRRLLRLAEECQVQWARVGYGARQANDGQLLDLVAAGHQDLAGAIGRLESLIESAPPLPAPAF